MARLLALNVGYYHGKYGDVPQETLLGMVRAATGERFRDPVDDERGST